LTSLNNFLFLINSIDIISITQVTPQKLNLIVKESSFWEILNILNDENLDFKFLEKRESSIDVHFLVKVKKTCLEVTFRIVEYDLNFVSKIERDFPSSRMYLQELPKQIQ